MNDLTITIQTIPDNMQRYDTAGDWQIAGDNCLITVSECVSDRYEQLIALHEIIEMLLCKWCGVSQEDVDTFDLGWQRERRSGEPGDNLSAPYAAQHAIASITERLAAPLLGVDWNAYEDALAE